jgi:DNA adenine methylase
MLPGGARSLTVLAELCPVCAGYAPDLYDDLLCTWSRREIATQTGNGGTDRARTEVLWSNRPFAQASLFDGLEAI